MSDFIKLLQEADLASLELERAKATVEVSKEAWEQAKEEYEDSRKALEKILFKADDMAIPRQRIRKLIDDRAQALMASGLMIAEASKKTTVKSSRAAKPKAAKALGKGKSEFKSENDKDSVGPELN